MHKEKLAQTGKKMKKNIKTIVSIIVLSGIIILGTSLTSYKRYLLSKESSYTLGFMNGKHFCGSRGGCSRYFTFYVNGDSFQASTMQINPAKGSRYVIRYLPINPDFASEVLIDLPISADDTIFKFGDTIPHKLIDLMRLK